MPKAKVQFKIKGIEKCRITQRVTKFEGEGEERKMITEYKKRKDKKDFFDKKETIKKFESLEKGDYELDFSFKLPDKLPASMIFKKGGKKDHMPAAAKVKYTLKCIINFKEEHDWKHKQILIVRSKPLKEKDDIKKVDEDEIKTWCCVS